MLKLKLQYFWCEELTHWERPWCWKRLKAGREGDDKGWDGWMAPLTQWTWVWASSRRWWRTGKPGMLQSMATQLDTTERLKTSKITQLSECKVPNWKWGGLILVSWVNASWVWESRGVNVKFLFPGKVYTSVTRWRWWLDVLDWDVLD